MDLSIVIVSWNGLDLLAKCLKSVQEHRPRFSWEVIVVDNGSTDGSPEMVATCFPDIKLIENKKNLGFSKANNIGIGAAKGRFLCLLNSDVEIKKGCFESMCKFLEKHPEVGILGPRILDPTGNVQRSANGFPTLCNFLSRALALDRLFPNSRRLGSYLMTFFSFDRTREVDVVNGCFWLTRRSALNEVGPLDETFFMYGEDIDWCRRFWSAGWKVILFSEAEAVHYGGGSSSNAPLRFYLEKQRAYLQYWRKYHGVTSLVAFALTIWLHHAIRFFGFSVKYLIDPTNRLETMGKLQRSAVCTGNFFYHSLQAK